MSITTTPTVPPGGAMITRDDGETLILSAREAEAVADIIRPKRVIPPPAPSAASARSEVPPHPGVPSPLARRT